MALVASRLASGCRQDRPRARRLASFGEQELVSGSQGLEAGVTVGGPGRACRPADERGENGVGDWPGYEAGKALSPEAGGGQVIWGPTGDGSGAQALVVCLGRFACRPEPPHSPSLT
jgi:hypothetical protein